MQYKHFSAVNSKRSSHRKVTAPLLFFDINPGFEESIIVVTIHFDNRHRLV